MLHKKLNDMKKLSYVFYLVLCFVVLTGCQTPQNKPFIVIGKHHWEKGDCDTYKFVDANGICSSWFDGSTNQYNIGDTLK